MSVANNAPRLLADLPSGIDLDFLRDLQRFHDELAYLTATATKPAAACTEPRPATAASSA